MAITFREVISEYQRQFSFLKENKEAIENEKKCFPFLFEFKEYLHSSIHNNLMQYHSKEDEIEIRNYCRYVITDLLPFVELKVNYYNNKYENYKKNKFIIDNELLENLNNYLDLLDDLQALASFRSLIHFALYMEKDDDSSDKVWEYILDDVMCGIFFYSNQMILNRNINTMVKQCPTGYGKCLHNETLVYTPKGNIKIKDIKVGDIVYSMKDNKIVERKVLNIWNTKKKQIKITTRSNKEIITSPEHRMFTQRGYVKASELNTNDYFYSMLSKKDSDFEIDDNELTFISGMIFEGSCTENIFSFTQEDNEFKDYFLSACYKLGLTYKQSTKLNNKASSWWFHKTGGKIRSLLKKYDIYECNSHTKRLPKQFFNMSLRQKYKFISYMLATDGYVGNETNLCECAGITLANKDLIQDIRYLLQTCGIFCSTNYKKVKCKNNEYDGWTLTIPNEYLKIIYDNCYVFHKQEKLNNRIKLMESNIVNSYCNLTNYPKEIVANCKEFKRENNKQWARNNTFKREKVEEFNNRTHLFDNVVYKDFVFEKIKNIEYIDEETDMVDIEVEETHNFIANGLVSHNSKSDCDIICFILGYDINADIFKVVGNPSILEPFFNNVVRMIKSDRFAKVFPQFAKYENKDDIFENISLKEGKFKLKDSNKPQSLRIINKETSIDGGRFMYQFYDDITQSKDADNMKQHEKDIKNYNDMWKKREYDEFSTLRWFSGTAYHKKDFLSIQKNRICKNDKPIPIKNNVKNWRRFCYTNADKNAILILVPKIENITDTNRENWKCTFPKKYSLASAIEQLENNPRSFWAMEQQDPLPPESMIFDYHKLKTYSVLPQEIKDNDCECVMIIDPARKAKNYVAGGIFKKAKNNLWYFVDCYYKKLSMKVSYPLLVNKIIWHKCDKVYYESNTDTSMDIILEDMLKKKGETKVKVDSFYSYLVKDDKIQSVRDDILENIVFPCEGMYSIIQDMGLAMKHFVEYNAEEPSKNKYDDAPDMIAMAQIIFNQDELDNSFDVIDRRKLGLF